MTTVRLVDAIRDDLRGAAAPDLAPRMQAYMKSDVPFLGVRVPVVRTLVRRRVAEHPPTSAAELAAAVTALWRGAEFREEQYAAAAVLAAPAVRGLREPGQLVLLEELIVDGAWWDHTDELSHRVGDLLQLFPDAIRPELVRWQTEPDRWLRRSSIICQLGHRARTDLDLLTSAVAANADDPDFFLRKAIGWSLRDYAKTDAEWVRVYVDAHPLSPLSRREALKHL